MKNKGHFRISIAVLLIISILSSFLLNYTLSSADTSAPVYTKPIFRIENQKIENGYYTNLNEYIDTFRTLNEGTIIVKFRHQGSSVMSLFSLSNKNQPSEHFHLYITPTLLGSENRRQGENIHIKTEVSLKAGKLYTVAMVVNQNGGYKFFLDGQLIYEDKTSPVRFMSNVYQPNSAQLGQTERSSGMYQYPFTGEIKYFEVYDVPLPDQEAAEKTNKYSPGLSDEIKSIIDENSWVRLLNYNIYDDFPSDNGTNNTAVYKDISQDANTIKSLSSGAIAAKFKTSDTQGINTIFSLTDTTMEKYNTYSTLAVKDGKLFFSITKDNSSPFVTDMEVPSGLISDGEWHIVTVIVNKEGTLIYLDGEKLLTNPNTVFLNLLSGANQASIGRSTASGSAGQYYFQDGEIAYVDIYSRDSEAPSPDLEKIRAMTGTTSNAPDDTWLFTGGAITQGVGQSGTVRNYIGHFEEAVRWEQATVNSSGSEYRRQRFMINGGREGQTVIDLNNNFSTLIEPFKAKAVSVMVGLEDSAAGASGIEDFKTNLSSLIDKIRASGAVPVLQMQNAITDQTKIHDLELYIDTALDVASDKDAVVVNHYKNWKDREAQDPGYISEHLNGDIIPNELGHLEIARDLIRELVGTTQGNTYNLTGFYAEKAVRIIPNDSYPTVTGVSDGKIKIDISSIKEALPEADKFYYEIPLNNSIKMTKNITNKTFETVELDSTQNYTVYLYAELSGKKRTVEFMPVSVTPVSGAVGKPVSEQEPELSPLAQAIKQKIETSENITWLFTGDSITHGALWTRGYESFPQIFEKRVRNEMGRIGDTVINAGVSSGTTDSFLANEEYQMNCYNADVVFIMFGMNDCVTITVDKFKTNLIRIVDDVRNKGAIPVLMAVNPAINASNRANLPSYINAVRQIASDYNVLLIDHYEMWEKVMEETPYIIGPSGSWMEDSIHPNYLGHLKIAQNIFKSIGIYDKSSEVCTLDYITSATTVTAANTPQVSVEDKTTVTVDIAQTVKNSPLQLSYLDVQLKLDDGIIYKAKVKSTDSQITFSGLKSSAQGFLTVLGYGKYENKVVKYQELTINLQPELDPDVNEDGIVNVGDLGIVSHYYGYYVGDTGWDKARKADVNNDEQVNIEDMMIIALRIIK